MRSSSPGAPKPRLSRDVRKFQRGSDTGERPYGTFQRDEMILRDHLAVDRTGLANERTLMSYVRTALAFLIAGASSIHFLTGTATEVLGIALMAVGLLTFAIGLRRFFWYKRRIDTTGSAPP